MLLRSSKSLLQEQRNKGLLSGLQIKDKILHSHLTSYQGAPGRMKSLMKGRIMADLNNSVVAQATPNQVDTPSAGSSPIKVLNLYAGIGGNRKLWENVEVTAVENEPKIAAIYQDFFPDDTVIIADAHQYLLDHFHEYDFIWSSPPCPTHSRIRTGNTLLPWKDNSKQLENGGGLKPEYPDMRLYQEIIFLKHFAKPGTKWVVENVISYYDPLIQPQEVNQHYFWANFGISPQKSKTRLHDAPQAERYAFKGFDLTKYQGVDKRKLIRNCVDPQSGLHVFAASQGTHYHAKGIELVAMDFEAI